MRVGSPRITRSKYPDRGLLLDTIAANMFYQIGVDSLRMTAVKHVTGGRVLIEIDCNRASPDADQFTITITDPQGRTLRRERYARPEINAKFDLDPAGRLETTPTTKPESPESRQRQLDIERRRELIKAATQPARVHDRRRP